MRIKEALLKGDISTIRSGLALSGLEATDEEIEGVIKLAQSRNLYLDCDSNMIWIKNKIGRFLLNPVELDLERFSTTLHIFFLYIAETEEMLDRLAVGRKRLRRKLKMQNELFRCWPFIFTFVVICSVKIIGLIVLRERGKNDRKRSS